MDTFRQADRRYTELKEQLDAGSLSRAEFDRQLEMLKVRDTQGRWWAKGREPNAWYYHDGEKWVRDTPQGYKPPPRTRPQPEPPPQPAPSPTTQQQSSSGLVGCIWLVIGILVLIFLVGMCSAGSGY
jgi:hypothetical protein